MNFLVSLEESAVGMTVSSTIWGYPIVLTLHAIGMAILVGISLMLCFRLLGFASQIPFTAFTPYWRLALFGFVVNLFSGLALFSGSASSLIDNWPFRIKIVLVIIGLLLTRRAVKACIRDEGLVTAGTRKLAILSILVWLAALVAGRLIGYVL